MVFYAFLISAFVVHINLCLTLFNSPPFSNWLYSLSLSSNFTVYFQLICLLFVFLLRSLSLFFLHTSWYLITFHNSFYLYNITDTNNNTAKKGNWKFVGKIKDTKGKLRIIYCAAQILLLGCLYDAQCNQHCFNYLYKEIHIDQINTTGQLLLFEI